MYTRSIHIDTAIKQSECSEHYSVQKLAFISHVSIRLLTELYSVADSTPASYTEGPWFSLDLKVREEP